MNFRSLTILIFTLGLFACASKKPVAVAPPPQSSPEKPKTEWKILGPFFSAPQEGSLDFLLAYGGESKIAPDDQQKFISELVKGAEISWSSFSTANDSVQIQFPNGQWDLFQPMYGIAGTAATYYAYREIDTPKETSYLAHMNGVGKFYIDGVPYWGQPYAYSFYKVPVHLKAGKHRLLLKLFTFGDPKFEFSMAEQEGRVTFGDDFTVPDLGSTGVKNIYWIGIPVHNLSTEFLSDLNLEFFKDNLRIAKGPIEFPIAPLSTVKIPAALPITAGANSVEIVCRITDKAGSVLLEHPFTLEAKKSNEAKKYTFLSKIDHSVQYFSVLPPKDFDPKHTYQAILSLHGANVEASDQIKTYAPKDWAFVIAPTNRRPHGFGWQDIGRLDALEVLDLALQMFPIDSQKVYLAGHSMGGQGTWHIGVFNPDRFQGLSPAAGWMSFESYIPTFFQKGLVQGPLSLQQMRERVQADSVNPSFLSNLAGTAVFITQANEDTNVPPLHSRRMFKLAREAGLESEIREIPSAEHWCKEPLIDGVGFQCVDAPEQYEFLKAHPKTLPTHLKIHLSDLSINSKFAWLKVLAQEKVNSPSFVDIDLHSDRIELKTTNISKVKIKIPKAPLKINRNAQIIWNEKILNKASVVWTKDSEIQVRSPGSNAQIAKKFQNSLSQYGSLKSVFHSPSLIVIGTHGSKEDQENLISLARLLSNRIWANANAYARTIKDSDLTEAQKKSYNLILLGSPTRNQITKTSIKDLPTANDSQFKLKKDQALVSVWPSPWKKDGLLLFISGASSQAELDAETFLPMTERQSSSNLDFFITSANIKKDGWFGLAAAGFYSPNWDLKNSDFIIAREND